MGFEKDKEKTFVLQEYLVNISLLLSVEKAILFLNEYPVLGQHRRGFSYSQDKNRGEFCFRMLLDKSLKLIPVTLVIPDLFA